MITRLKELLFQNRNTKQTIVKNIFWLSMSQLGSRLIRAVIIIYAARVLGVAEYGIFSYVLGFVGFFTLFADIGVNSLLTRNVASHPEKKNEYFATSFWIKTALITFVAFLIIFIAPRLTNIEQAAALLPFMVFLVIFDNIRDLAIAYFRGREQMEKEALIVIFMNIAIVAAGFAILSISQTAKYFIFSYIASVGLASVLALFMVKNQLRKILSGFNKKIAKETVANSWPIAFSSMIGIFMLNTDIVMLGWWKSAEEIGYYSAGQRIIQVLYTLPGLLGSAIFPVVSKMVKQGKKEATKTLNEKSMTIIFLLSIPLTVGGVILSKDIIELIFGKDYLPGALAFQILMATMIINFSSIIFSNLILAHNQQRQSVKYLAAGALSNVVLNALLIPPFGINGAAIATFISQTLFCGLAWRFIKKIEDFKTLFHLKKIIAGAIIMGLFSLILNKLGINVIINIILSAGIYFGILYLLKEKIIDEIKSILKLAKI